MQDLVHSCSPGIDGAVIEQQSRVESKKVGKIMADLQNISDKVSVEHVNRILYFILKNVLVIKALQQRTGMSTLQ